MKILIVEDEPSLRELIQCSLEKERYVVETASDFNSALRKVEDYDYDCILLDIMLPDGSGLNLLERLKALHKRENVIIISAKDSLEDKVLGLELGADDYLPKPYDPKEMHARIMSLIRRYKRTTQKEENVVVDSAFRIDEKRHEIFFHDAPLTLTPAEYEILEYLIKQHSFSVSREQLVYHCKSLKDKDSKSLDVIIGRLRAKIGDNSKNPTHIFSVRGIGYKLIG